jgi:hypothetical protein
MSDSSRGDLRFIGGQPFSTCYRNKLQLERDFSFGSLALRHISTVSYTTLRAMMSGTETVFGRGRGPGQHLVLETYYLRQNNSRSSNPHVNAAGLIFHLYF